MRKRKCVRGPFDYGWRSHDVPTTSVKVTGDHHYEVSRYISLLLREWRGTGDGGGSVSEMKEPTERRRRRSRRRRRGRAGQVRAKGSG